MKEINALAQQLAELLRTSDSNAQIRVDLALEALKESLPHGSFVRLCETLQGSLDHVWGELYGEDAA